MTSVELLAVMQFSIGKMTTKPETAPPVGLTIAAAPSARDRVVARWRARRLDLALAAGMPPEADPAMALRARRLTDLACRRSIAETLRRFVREAHEGAAPSLVRIFPSRRRVRSASDQLSQLANTLAEPGPVSAHGVAQAWLLITDGSGPLYNPSSPASLRDRVLSAAEDLRPWPV
jgi:hypothetical protein